MKNKLYQDIRNGIKKPLGGLCLCNFGGLCVYDINSDFIVSGFSYGDDNISDLRKTKIFETITGRFYFVRFSRRYYLDEISRF